MAPTTVSLVVAELSRKGVLIRTEDEADRRRRIIDLSATSRPAISEWLSPGARSWRAALAPLTGDQRRMVVDTLRRYEQDALGRHEKDARGRHEEVASGDSPGPGA